jgi:catechol 2,3-dioxygenase-like lactoylglutathione lyase family enzyme
VRTYRQAKDMAKTLRASLASKNVSVSHDECLELVASQLGFGSWNILAAKIDIDTREHDARPVAQPVNLFQLVPVLRVASRQAASEFYAGVLGFEFDWGDEEPAAGRAWYAQVSRDELQIHLTTESHPRAGSQVYFRMKGLDALLAEFSAKLPPARLPAIHHTNYDARELEIEDPFGNVLRFVEGNPPGVSPP